MVIERYAQFFKANEAFFGADAGWYAVEITDCDTIIEGEYDGNEVRPFSCQRDAERHAR